MGSLVRRAKPPSPSKHVNLTTDEILDNTIRHTNQYVLTTQPNFGRKCDTELSSKTEMKVFIGLVGPPAVLHGNKQRNFR